MSALNEMTNYTDFIVEKKVEGTYKLKRTLAKLAYNLGPIALVLLLSQILPTNELRTGAIAIGLLVIVPLYYCNLRHKLVIPATFKYLQISYEYMIKGGEFIFNTIYGANERKEIFTHKAAEMDVIAPMAKYVEDPSIEVKYDCLAYKEHPDNYFATFTNSEGKKCVVFFQATNKAIKILGFLNRNTDTDHVAEC